LPLKNKTNLLSFPFICYRLGRSRMGKEKAREKERKVREKHKNQGKK
jgi:hypothetical protein